MTIDTNQFKKRHMALNSEGTYFQKLANKLLKKYRLRDSDRNVVNLCVESGLISFKDYSNNRNNISKVKVL